MDLYFFSLRRLLQNSATKKETFPIQTIPYLLPLFFFVVFNQPTPFPFAAALFFKNSHWSVPGAAVFAAGSLFQAAYLQPSQATS
jgi:hypothetical protein